jgi:hypothetical protein
VKNREMHNMLEKNRRAHLKNCFDNLRDAVPGSEDIKQSTVAIIQNATKYIEACQYHALPDIRWRWLLALSSVGDSCESSQQRNGHGGCFDCLTLIGAHLTRTRTPGAAPQQRERAPGPRD